LKKSELIKGIAIRNSTQAIYITISASETIVGWFYDGVDEGGNILRQNFGTSKSNFKSRWIEDDEAYRRMIRGIFVCKEIKLK